MNYTSAVSIIPGGCPQFLDCRLDAKSLGRFWSYFREVPQSGESAIATSRRPTELVPVPVDDAGQPGDYDYKIDAIRALETFEGRWVPVPFLRLSNEQWKDGSFTCEKGPSNWVRLHVSRDEGDVYRLTFQSSTVMDYGFSTAVGLFKNVINFALILAANWASKAAGGDGIM